jgi:leucyl-tRNA---protein transferase
MSSDFFKGNNDIFLEKRLRFYLTSPQPCPYLPNRLERKVFTTLNDIDSHHLNDKLTQAGFRRSQNIAYRPACDMCAECVSVRVKVQEFIFTKSWRRILKIAPMIDSESFFSEANEERFELIQKYLNTRHLNQGMSDMNADDFISMLEECTLNSRVIDYRLKQNCELGEKGKLIACVLLDELSDGKSLIYSFYDPNLEKYSLGTYLILNQIEDTKLSGREFLYLGYFIKDCQKMNYKARFEPMQKLGSMGWQ